MKRLIVIGIFVAATSHAFAQQKCVKTAVNLSGNQLTLTTSGAKSTTSRENYVYYERKHHRKHDKAYPIAGVAYKYPSKPILLNSSVDVRPVPEKYNVSVALPEPNMTACADSATDLTASLNVERVASYTGNYLNLAPEKNYQKVSKRHYKIAMRQKRKIERKEEKIARRTHVGVEVKSTKA